MVVGFIGLGVMGQPMALNLARAGISLVVWNRSADRAEPIRRAGATMAASPAEVFRHARVVMLMLGEPSVIDVVLDRHGGDFETRVAGRTIVSMGTVPPDYSHDLERAILGAGGSYVEAAVSGSRQPAEAGQLVAIMAGANDVLDSVRPIMRPMCRDTICCGAVPNASLMKLAINLYLIAMVTALGEAVHFAGRHDLDLGQFLAVLDAGPMASAVAHGKALKLIARDFTVQASIADVANITQLIARAARDAAVASPLSDVCAALFTEAMEAGAGEADMAGIIRAIESRSDRKAGGLAQ